MRMIIPLLMSDKGPPPAHSLRRSRCDPEPLAGGEVACVRPFPSWTAGLTSTYSGGWNDCSNYCSSVGLDRLSSLL